MENPYKYFSPIYKYLKNSAFKTLLYMGFLGFRIAFYISQQPLYQTLYRILFVKKPRNSNDILVEPIDTPCWLCKSYINPVTSSSVSPSSSSKLSSRFSFRNRGFSSSKSSFKTFYPIFEMKEQYLIPPSNQFVTPSSSSDTEIQENKDSNLLYTYSFPVSTENTEKIFRIIRNRPFSVDEIPKSPPLSSVSFVDIQYHHPDMKDMIVLQIPKEWCCVGNVLFSSAFILRMLYYQTLPFTFDKRYFLEIMDHELNMITLQSHNLILINERSYDIIDTCS